MLALLLAHSGSGLSRLRTEYMIEPLGLDIISPRFSWALSSDGRAEVQVSYQIIVHEAAGGTMVWNSTRVESNTTQNVRYAGASLQSGTAYAWSVTSSTQTNGDAMRASSIFTMGLLTHEAWKSAEWIGSANHGSGLQLRHEFTVPVGRSVTRAMVYSVGLAAVRN